MLKREITYKNLDGEQVTKEFYFNLTQAELVELEMSFPGGVGLVESINRIAAANDSPTMMREFKRIILMTYGVREGDEFIKSNELNRSFEATNAYSALFMEFLTVEGALIKFLEGVMPEPIPEPANAPKMPPPPTNFAVAKLTDQQIAMGQSIIEGTANG